MTPDELAAIEHYAATCPAPAERRMLQQLCTEVRRLEMEMFVLRQKQTVELGRLWQQKDEAERRAAVLLARLNELEAQL